MTCHHTTLELLPARKRTLRCRHCHLTIAAAELGDNCCPECLEATGRRHYEFDELAAANPDAATYRCEECGAIVKS